jgi:hypothetical protein
MNRIVSKIVRAAVVGLMAALPLAMAPCQSSLQYPLDNTETFWGVALALPKVGAAAKELLSLDGASAVDAGEVPTNAAE